MCMNTSMHMYIYAYIYICNEKMYRSMHESVYVDALVYI